MKKIIFTIIISLIIMMNVKADGSVPPVQFNLIENFYSDVTKTYSNGLTTFKYKNNLLTMDLTDNELKTLLSQKPGNGSTRLTYYETLNILVTPVEGTPYESLKGKTTFYRANSGGAWLSDKTNYESEMVDTAEVFNLNNNFWHWGFKIQYRLNETDAWGSSVPSGKDLTNKTLEQQLATIFDINLTQTPNGVIDLYPNKIRFNPLPSGYTYALRFDFLDNKDTAPILKESSTTEYLTSSLKHLGREYVIIEYDRSEDAPTNKIIEDEKTSNTSFNKILLAPLSLIAIGIIYLIVYLKKNRIRVIK